ncbi:hypothetical protein NXS19_011110 [Fusarium pseudograminearum]|uniref:C2H2-type domain-containing protein n=1 Tax=Fusarium pseudograminearum (strain CS3096) TaxID=1028729 RepID=K3VPN8_FUSPC|nr:hypothetical protein FPSE_02917 [Fusarium pseudograminearum CS3096]EKJ76919.1 hypothetical protein FPSE_02917 [Fusarium pseudograminearum CS3096]UZP43294.1 hypothetical protein NXS19_011110 [Fusarium pseudograminearum]
MGQENSEGAPAPTLFALSKKSFAALDQAVAYTTDHTDPDLRVTLEDERGRLRVWASNLGALQQDTSKKSLDYRLRDAPLMRTTVALGLENLCSSADRALAIINGSVPNRSATLPSDDGNTKTINELDELLAGIHSAINHLFGISILIRKQQPRGRLLNLDDFTLESSQDITYVADRFPKAKSNLWLARRLGNNISKQRKIIQYRQEHRASLAKESEQSGVGDTATVVATTYHEIDNLESSDQVPKGVSSSGMSAFTSATSFQSLRDEEGMGRPIPDLSDMTLDGVQLQYGEPFECPYCRTIQVAANRYEWKRHVFADLQPYMCTIKDCRSGNKSFSTRGEWFEHESNFHRWQWECSWCNTPNSTFPSSESFKQHLNKSHPGMVTGAQMPMIVDACERSIRTFNSGSCPLCEDWKPTSANNNAKGFSRHLARHLQQLSLASIPISTPGLEIKISDDASDVADRSIIESVDKEDVQNIVLAGANSALLFLAAKQGDEKIIMSLLKAGVDVNMKDDEGRTPLSLASSNGHTAVVRILLDHGASVRTGDVKTLFSLAASKDNRGPITSSQTISRQDSSEVPYDRSVPKDEPQRQQSVPQGPEQIEIDRAKNEATLLKLVEDRKKTADAVAAEDAAKEMAAQELRAKVGEGTSAKLEEFETRAEHGKIRFTDAVGRKFSFPFHLCATWQGMEDLIKQAFVQVDVLGPHVMERHYDLIAPGGEIILPSAWERVIKPDWAITMTMWPMDKLPPLGRRVSMTQVYL